MTAFRYRAVGLGWTLSALLLLACSDTKVNVVGPVTGTIQGMVTVNGSGVPNVQVTLSGGTSRSATTSASGSYSFTDVLQGSYTISLSSPPQGVNFPSTTQTAVISSAGQTATVNFAGTLQPPGAPSNLQASVSETSVTLTWSPGARSESQRIELTPAGGGTETRTVGGSASSVQIGGLIRGTSYGARVVAVNSAGETPSGAVSFQIDVARGTIQGTVQIEADFLAGVTIRLSGSSGNQSATTNGSGFYSFTGVPVGTYEVSAEVPDDVSVETPQTTQITSHGQVVTVDFGGSYVRTSSIVGTVTVDGAGLGGVTVDLTGVENSNVGTDASGQYSFPEIRAGDYTVTISGFDTSQYNFSVTSQEVSVDVDETGVVNFSGTRATNSSISGRVYVDVDQNGDCCDELDRPLQDVTVTLTGAASRTTTTDAAGTYAFTELPPGSYTVTITNPDPDRLNFESTSRVVDLGTEETALFNAGAVWRPVTGDVVAYIVNSQSSDMKVVDVSSRTIVVSVPTGPGNRIAVPFHLGIAYVTEFSNDQVSLIDLPNMRRANTFSVGDGPGGVAFTPDGATAYVANSNSDDLSVIDVGSGSVTTIRMGDGPSAIAIAPDGTTAYVGQNGSGSDNVAVVDLDSNTVTDSIDTGDASDIVVAPDGSTAYVAAGGDVVVIDLSDNSVAARIEVGGSISGLAVSPDGSEVYAVNIVNPDRASVIETATNSVSGSIEVGENPLSVAFTPDGDTVLVPNAGSDDLSFIDVQSRTVVATIDLLEQPNDIVIVQH